MNKQLVPFGTSIFTEMSLLATEHNAINLSQGFPNFEGPQELKQVLIEEVQSGWNQYIPSFGLAELRETIAEYFANNYKLNYQPGTEITVTQGATEALFNTITGLFNSGDEVIVFEPFYDAYIPDLALVGGKSVAVELPLNRALSLDDFEGKISLNTKGIIVNTPHNPTGKIFSKEELQVIADIAKRYDLIVISDEVYEHILFDGNEHISISTLEGMQERTVVISSIGKTFSYTGWKVGWAVAPAHLSKGIRASHQFTTFSTVPATQKAASAALKLDKSYFTDLKRMYQEKRDILVKGVSELGFKVLHPAGTYFFLAEYSAFSDKPDIEFAKELIERCGVALIPPSVFYLNGTKNKHLRFCFSKTDDVLHAALDHLATV